MGRTRINLDLTYHPNQAALFDHPAKVKTSNKGRRFGLTQGVSHYIIENAADKSFKSILWVDTINANIDRYVDRYFKPKLKVLPESMWKWNIQRKEMKFFMDGGTTASTFVDFRSADHPENIEGFGYDFVFLNEAGIILKDRALYENSIRPMFMDHDPRAVIGGTPKGKNLFFELVNKSKSGDSRYQGWENFHFTSYDNPFLKRSVIDELSETLPEMVRRQEIYAEFLEDVSSVFGDLRAVASLEPETVPPRSGETYYPGFDLAKHQDFFVGVVLDSQGRMVDMKRYQHRDYVYQQQDIAGISKRYNNAAPLIDSTGVGDPVFDALASQGCPVDGYKFTNDSKQKLIQNLMLGFENGELQIWDDRALLDELAAFEYEILPSGRVRYTAPSGLHDDMVIALALAFWNLKNGNVTPSIMVV